MANKQCIEEKVDALNQLANLSLKLSSSLSASIVTQTIELKSITFDLEKLNLESVKEKTLCTLRKDIQNDNLKLLQHYDKLLTQQNEFQEHVKLIEQYLKSLSASIATQTIELKSITLDLEKLNLESVKEKTLCTLRKDIQNDNLKLLQHYDKLLTQQNEFQEHAKLIEQYSKLILVNNILGQADKILKIK